ncbi:hypothetical protein K8R03_00300 [Candidatus Kaiserbacteria bacterium]|nr:hypothetical protein [Candidatus Kaiserbacteria bacterium]
MPTDNSPINNAPQPPVPQAIPAHGRATYLYIAIAAAVVAVAGTLYLFRNDFPTGMLQQNSADSPAVQQDAASAEANAQLDAAMPSDSNADFESVDADINQL